MVLTRGSCLKMLKKRPLFCIEISIVRHKVHKDQQHPSGRPIVASMNSVTSGFSLYIDSFLQPLAQNIQSYIRDSIHLLELLAPYTWQDSYSWLSFDVNSLYTFIPHHIGMLATHFLLQDPMLHTKHAAFILDATCFYLTQIIFISRVISISKHMARQWALILHHHMTT